MDQQQIRREIAEIEPYVIETRRCLHRHPEPSGQEHHTRRFIVAELEKWGIPYQLLRGTGIIGEVKGALPGGVVALRADIDALPMQEEPTNMKQEKTCVSEVPGAAHTCGHDAHTAMLLGAAQVLLQHRSELGGTILLCFEEGEENSCGIDAMMEGLAPYHPDAVWGMHVMSNLEAGKICLAPGPRLAGSAGIDFTVHGRSGHGSRPDLSINPVFAAAHILTSLSTAWVNERTAGETVTLAPTCVDVGPTAYNIIPEQAHVLGSMRYFNLKEGEAALKTVKRIASLVGEAHRCTVTFGPTMKMGVLPTVNDPERTQQAIEALQEVFPAGTVVEGEKMYGSETMSRYLAAYPGCFALLGVRNEERGITAEQHSCHYDLEESALKEGVLATVTCALRFAEICRG